MTLRLVFEREDLQRVRVAPAADPMWELVLGLSMARATSVTPRFSRWCELVRRRAAGGASQSLELLADLFPSTGRFPDTLTPAPLTSELDAGCVAIAGAGGSRLAADLAATYLDQPAPSWVKKWAGGDRQLRGDVVTAVRRAHEVLVEPFWDQIVESVQHDRFARQQTIGDHGLGRLLAGLPGIVNWDGRVLTCAYPLQRTVHLQGRGITLLPSYFCRDTPVTFIDPELPPLLVYPVGTPAPGPRCSPHPSRELVALFGRTRAQSLHAVQEPRTTSGIADFLGSSVSAASKQMTVLRDAGLVTSARTGSAVVHRLTGLGRAMVREATDVGRQCFPRQAKAS